MAAPSCKLWISSEQHKYSYTHTHTKSTPAYPFISFTRIGDLVAHRTTVFCLSTRGMVCPIHAIRGNIKSNSHCAHSYIGRHTGAHIPWRYSQLWSPSTNMQPNNNNSITASIDSIYSVECERKRKSNIGIEPSKKHITSVEPSPFVIFVYSEQVHKIGCVCVLCFQFQQLSTKKDRQHLWFLYCSLLLIILLFSFLLKNLDTATKSIEFMAKVFPVFLCVGNDVREHKFEVLC